MMRVFKIMRRLRLPVCLGVGLLIVLAGCRSGGEPLPPVFGAVFGVTGAATTPYSTGKIPDPVVGTGDDLVGAAANNPGQCIWRSASGNRFRAGCPENYAP